MKTDAAQGEGGSSQTPGLYVHVPFCVSRCTYCAFCSQTDLSLRAPYVQALAREAAARGAGWAPFDTVYLGGGTPTVLGAAGLAALIEGLGHLATTPDCCWTIEANPDDLSPALLASLRALGFTRISLGVQSFDDRWLHALGRRHSGAAAEAAVRMAQAAGFADLSLDLMYNLPEQDLPHWQQELERALALGPTHLSAYELTLEPSTPLARQVAHGALPSPSEDMSRAMFLLASDLLVERGWQHYEVSNYASAPNLKALHNQKYWRHVPYLGLGPGAHSFDGQRRCWNPDSLPTWLERISAGRPALEGQEILDETDLRLERLALGLRTAEGVHLTDLRGRERVLKQAISRGWLQVENGRARPTREGYLWADGLAVQFA